MKRGAILRHVLSATTLFFSLRLLGCGGAEPLHGASDGGDPSDASALDAFTEAPPASGASSTSCAPPSPCGSSGVTTEQCTTTDGTGACTQRVYQTSDGHTFACASCTSCISAQQELSSYCAQPDASSPVTTCTSPSPCGTTGSTYALCTTDNASGTCAKTFYQTSVGATYNCASCTDCANALASLTAQCSSTSCSSPSPCSATTTYDLCTTTGITGACTGKSYKTSSGTSYACASCSDCAAAEASLDSACPSIGATCGGCTTDQQCQNACPPVQGGGTNCCDVGDGVCYATTLSQCPVPSDGGTE